ncbi:MAG: SDR family NAD(P)-dependent oxidoreductase, partial [Chloroflexi bacterium]|nr:SDR family NAD(P)-dependent oxidoreductase [Chloroflexota bacterium]
NPQSSEILLEVGPGHTLSALVRQSGHDLTGRVIVSSLRRPSEQQPDLAFLLNTLGQLILAGVPIDWPAFYRDQRRQRLPLPTYPFEPQRYWIDPQPIAATTNAQPSLDKKPQLADWGYLPIWKQTPLPTPKIDAEPATWLIFAHADSLSAGLSERLEQAGHYVVTARAGRSFAQLGDRSYSLNPREPDQYEALIQALGDQPISKIVHAWSVTPDDVENLDRPGLGFYSLLFLAQALGKHAQNTPIELSVLTDSAHEIVGGDGKQPEQATVLGPVKVIPQEYSQISCRSVDLVLPTTERHKRQLFDQLVAELLAPPADTLVAYRGNQRWTQDFAPLPIEPSSTAPTRLRENGVYLITGGLGAIGLVLAEYLARTVRAKLVLVGRSDFPPRAAWPELIATADEHDATRRRIEQVQALEELGAEVLIASADVADPRQMQPVLDQTIERFGTIHGVIHAAGVPAGGMIQTKTAASAAGVLAPKVQGTQVLFKLLRDQPLDFIVLCSSISAVVGAFGQIDHCAANAFLDAWARHHAAHSDTPITAINWPAWQDVGQAANAAIPAELLAWRNEQLKQGIVAAEGAELFGRILDLDTPQVIVSPQDLSAVIEQNRTLNAATYLAALEAGQISTPSHPRPLLRTAYVAPRNEIEQTVAEIWQLLLGIEQIGIHDNFFELGGHSLLATQIVSRIRERLQVELSLRQLLETPTIADVALAIVQQQGAQAGDDLLAQMLMELEELSDDDARDLLDFEAPVAE